MYKRVFIVSNDSDIHKHEPALFCSSFSDFLRCAKYSSFVIPLGQPRVSPSKFRPWNVWPCCWEQALLKFMKTLAFSLHHWHNLLFWSEFRMPNGLPCLFYNRLTTRHIAYKIVTLEHVFFSRACYFRELSVLNLSCFLFSRSRFFSFLSLVKI